MKKRNQKKPSATVHRLSHDQITAAVRRGKWEGFFNLALSKFIDDMPKGNQPSGVCISESCAIARAARHFANEALAVYDAGLKTLESSKKGGAA